jgi:hypothetical protein
VPTANSQTSLAAGVFEFSITALPLCARTIKAVISTAPLLTVDPEHRFSDAGSDATSQSRYQKSVNTFLSSSEIMPSICYS